MASVWGMRQYNGLFVSGPWTSFPGLWQRIR